MKHPIGFLLIPALLAGVSCFAVGQKEEEAQQRLTLKMGIIAPKGHPVEMGCQYFVKIVRERTNGAVEIELYTDNSSGNELELQNGAKLGKVDLINVGCGVTTAAIPEYHIVSFHYVWKSPEHMQAFFKTDIVKEWDKRYLDTTNIRILASNWEQQNRHLVSKRPIRSVEDLKGLKIRVPEAETFIAAWKAMGVDPTPMAFGDAYNALQQGVLDAVEAPLDWIEKMKFYEQAGYIILTGHLQYVNQVQISEKSFQKLSRKNQEIISQAALDAGDYASEISREIFAGLRSKIEAGGIEFIEVDRPGFAAKVYEIVPDYEEHWGNGLWDRVQSVSY